MSVEEQEYIYELVDNSDYERYQPLGVFSSFERAEKKATDWNNPPIDEEPEDYFKLSIYKRPLNKWSDLGEEVWAQEWTFDYMGEVWVKEERF